MRWTYILKSEKNSKYYIGSTENLDERIRLHNAGRVKSTRLSKPWMLYYSEKFLNDREAYSREIQIKRWKSRKMIEKLKFP